MIDHSTLGSAPRNADLIVVGGGLAGLIAAAKVAREGRSVLVVEQSKHWGGRAATQVKEGRHLNLGAHALYCGGHAFRLLQELQVPFTGNFPNGGRAVLLKDRTEFALPGNIWSLLTSGMLSLREKWVFSRWLKKLPPLTTEHLEKISLQTWIEQQAGHGNLAAFLRTMFRLNTFVADAENLSAAAAIDQFKMGLAGNVWYLDGGWQSLIDGLRHCATAAGAEFRTSSSANRVRHDADGVTVTLANGEVIHGRSVILAVPPTAACQILDLPDDAKLTRWTHEAIPVRVACLDVCLDQLSRPEYRFALGLDRPVYYSVHSAAAKLAPEGIAVVHLMKYLAGDVDKSNSNIEAELEGVLDQLQPGWRAQTVDRRFLPSMSVTYCLPTAAMGGLAGRPGVTVPKCPGVYLAGDWVGSRGNLADASAASAEEAADSVLNRLLNEMRPTPGEAQHVGT